MNKWDEILQTLDENTDIKVKRTKTRPHGTLEYKLTKPRNTFSLNLPGELKEPNV